MIYTRALNSAQVGRTILSCTLNSETQFYNLLKGSAISGMVGVYTTNIAGVGVRVSDSLNRTFQSPSFRWSWASPFQLAGNFKFELIKTGPITGGTLEGGRLFTWTTAKTSGGDLMVGWGDVTGGTITSVACSVTSPTINVPMGNVPRNLFTRVGHREASRVFYIGLNCDANTRINMQIDATPDSSGTAGVMALDPSVNETAKGIGIQLLHNGIPVVFGAPKFLSVAPSAGGRSIPIIASYYQTSPNVVSGKANGTATFTMMYN